MSEWRPVKYFEGLYEVSDSGEVRETGTKRPAPSCRVFVAGHRVLVYSLTLPDGKHFSSYTAAYLVCQNFKSLGLPSRYVRIRYRDDNRQNLSPDNLYWEQLSPEEIARNDRFKKTHHLLWQARFSQWCKHHPKRDPGKK